MKIKITKYILFAILIVAALAITACDGEDDQDIIENELNDEVQLECDLDLGETYCPSLGECTQVRNEYCEEYTEYYIEPAPCTKEYMPVTGNILFPCNTGECTITTEFGNRCMAEAAGAENIELVNWMSDDEELEINIQETETNMIFTIQPSQQIYIPSEGFFSPEKLTGPWEIYYEDEETQKWTKITINNMCTQPSCNALNEPIAACSPINHAAYCEKITEEQAFEWNKKHIIRDTDINCYETINAEPGRYKIKFTYKTETCELFEENINTIEKIFILN